MTSFTDRARLFIQTGTEDQKSLLCECMEANNLDALRAVQMMSEDMYGGITFNYELKAPAAVCLIRWGEEGLNALIEAAERTKASKNNALALDILASLASCAALPEFAEHFVDESLLIFLRHSVSDWETLSAIARNKLQAFILSFDDDDDVCLAIGHRFQTAPFFGGSAVARELFQAVASRWLAVVVLPFCQVPSNGVLWLLRCSHSNFLMKQDHLSRRHQSDERWLGRNGGARG